MKNKKKTCIVFAVLVAALMLMTPTMARPVAEKTTMDIVETTEQELINQLEFLNIKLSRDVKVNDLMGSLTRDPVVSRAIEQFEQAVTEEEMSMALEQLVVSIEEKSELTQLENLIERGYTVELEALNEQLSIIIDGNGDIGTQSIKPIGWLFLFILYELGLGWLFAYGWFWFLFWLIFNDGEGNGGTPSM